MGCRARRMRVRGVGGPSWPPEAGRRLSGPYTVHLTIDPKKILGVEGGRFERWRVPRDGMDEWRHEENVGN